LAAAAASVHGMDEPVVDTGSVLAALAHENEGAVLSFSAGPESAAVDFETSGTGENRRWDGVRVDPHEGAPRTLLRPRAVVLCAGVGNEELLRRAGIADASMQRRPLRMFLLRGELDELFAHCVVGGKTRLTVTSADLGKHERVWQLGGEVAERTADLEDREADRWAKEEIARWLPHVDRSRLRLGSYRAVRAEAKRADAMRPSGVHVRRVAQNAVVAWPTKMALAPLLAEEIHREIATMVPGPGGPASSDRWRGWRAPRVAPYPWEKVEWRPAL
jgi:hypothetical protein